jgi:hypothetical protein
VSSPPPSRGELPLSSKRGRPSPTSTLWSAGRMTPISGHRSTARLAGSSPPSAAVVKDEAAVRAAIRLPWSNGQTGRSDHQAQTRQKADVRPRDDRSPPNSADRCDTVSRAGVPEDQGGYRTELEIALADIDWARGASLRFGCVLANAGYSLSASFRQGLSEGAAAALDGWHPLHAEGLSHRRGDDLPCRRASPPAKAPCPGRDVDERGHDAGGGALGWRRETKGRLEARFATRRVRVADGPPQRIGTMGARHLPGKEVWLIGELRSTGERKHYRSNLPIAA